MTLKPAVFTVLGTVLVSACVSEPPEIKPITISDKCAQAIAPQAGVPVDAVKIEEVIGTAIGPKIYGSANGVGYTCQGDLNGNITGVSLNA